jgi:hypothetical protein
VSGTDRAEREGESLVIIGHRHGLCNSRLPTVGFSFILFVEEFDDAFKA